MPEGLVLDFAAITKQFGAVRAVDGFTARVEPGAVTGFLGPNGAGKTTTLRMLLGLVRPSSGTSTIGGRRYADLPHPLQTVGAALEASAYHPGRTAANHLAVYAQAAGLPRARVDEVLGLVGLADVAGRKIGGYSLGMRQRLGLAYALLGDPGVLVLDEPANGLDPEGIRWMRGLLRELARQGRTVLVSSHLLAEVQQTADRLLVISQGRLVFQGGMDELADPSEYSTVVDAPDRAALSAALRTAGIEFETLRSGLTVRGADPVTVGAAAASEGVALSALQRRGPSLEEVFLELVSGVRTHPSAGGAVEAAPDPAPEVGVEVAATEAAVAEAAAVPAVGVEVAATEAAVAEAAAAPEAEVPEAEVPEAEVAAPAVSSPPIDEDESDAAGGVDAGEAPADQPVTARHTYAVASTGIIDVIPAAEPEAPEAETEEPDAAPIEEHHPTGERTESDDAADAFFSSFDHEGEQSAEESEDAGPAEHADEGEAEPVAQEPEHPEHESQHDEQEHDEPEESEESAPDGPEGEEPEHDEHEGGEQR